VHEERRSCALLISLEHLDAFRESYGFVASDDVLRRVQLDDPQYDARAECGDDFLGHIGPVDFVLTVAPANLSALVERLQSRLDHRWITFIRSRIGSRLRNAKDRLAVKMSEMPLAAGGHISNVEQLKSSCCAGKNRNSIAYHGRHSNL